MFDLLFERRVRMNSHLHSSSLQHESLPAFGRRSAGLGLSLSLRRHRDLSRRRLFSFKRGRRILGIRRALTTRYFVARRSLEVLDFTVHFAFTRSCVASLEVRHRAVALLVVDPVLLEQVVAVAELD